jgi:hypothetical protein
MDAKGDKCQGENPKNGSHRLVFMAARGERASDRKYAPDVIPVVWPDKPKLITYVRD